MKICLIMPQLYPYVVGGAEIQTYLIGKYLVRQGHEVHWVAVWHRWDQPPPVNEVGIHVHVIDYKNKDPFSQLGRIIDEIKPDLCYLRKFEYIPDCFKICKKRGIPLVYQVAHRLDLPFIFGLTFKNELKNFINFLRFLRNGSLYKNLRSYLLLGRMDYLISVSHMSRSGLLRKAREKCAVVYNSTPCERKMGSKREKIALWTSNIKRIKQPELFIELARRLKDTDIQFRMIGEIQDKRYKPMLDRANHELANFEYMGKRELEEVQELLGRSALLVHTCVPEGFPNNFIQAWLAGVPVVTYEFDVDNIIERCGLGYYAHGDFNKFVAQCLLLCEDEEQNRQMGERAIQFARENHDPEINIRKIEEIFKKVAMSK